MSRSNRRRLYSRREHEQHELGRGRRRRRGLDDHDVLLIICNGCGETIDAGPFGDHSPAACAAQQAANVAGDVQAEAAA